MVRGFEDDATSNEVVAEEDEATAEEEEWDSSKVW